MTASESQKIQELQDAFVTATNAYNLELLQNNDGKIKISNGGPWVWHWNSQPTSENDFKIWFAASTAALAAKKAAMDSAETAYKSYKETIEKRDTLTFASSNPGVFKDIETAKAAAAANYASNKTKYIAVAVVVLVVALVVVYFKFRKKKAA